MSENRMTSYVDRRLREHHLARTGFPISLKPSSGAGRSDYFLPFPFP